MNARHTRASQTQQGYVNPQAAIHDLALIPIEPFSYFPPSIYGVHAVAR